MFKIYQISLFVPRLRSKEINSSVNHTQFSLFLALWDRLLYSCRTFWLPIGLAICSIHFSSSCDEKKFCVFFMPHSV